MSKLLNTCTRIAVLAVAAAGATVALPQAEAHAAGGTTYYVSPSGNDSASGTSPNSALRTVGRASGLNLGPGDSVLFQRGATFSGKLAVWKSGAAGSPISSNTVASTAETASRTPHCAGAESFSNRAGDWGSGAAGMAGLVPVGPFTVNPDRWSGRATGS